MTILKTGIYGYPLDHSKAPRLYQHWISKYEVSGSYEAVRVAPDDFEETLRRHVNEGWRGGSVTMPHKVAALGIADEATDNARAIGSSNTLIFRDGRIIADNYDGVGFIENLRLTAGANFDPSKPGLVFGAGGAARAVIHAMLDAGLPELRLANRTREKAEELKDQFGDRVTVIDWNDSESALPGAATIVNTTSMGMKHVPPLPFSLDRADDGAVAADIIVSPLELTPFLRVAKARELTIVEGLGMLLFQAPPGFEAWFGVRPEVDDQVREIMSAP
jgi:shikimate dehydrogenase